MEPQQTTNDQGMTGQNPEAKNNSHTAGTIAGVLFIIILALIALYLYGALVADEDATTPAFDVEPVEESDQLSDLENDLENFDVESLETTDSQVESDLETVL